MGSRYGRNRTSGRIDRRHISVVVDHYQCALESKALSNLGKEVINDTHFAHADNVHECMPFDDPPKSSSLETPMANVSLLSI